MQWRKGKPSSSSMAGSLSLRSSLSLARAALSRPLRHRWAARTRCPLRSREVGGGVEGAEREERRTTRERFFFFFLDCWLRVQCLFHSSCSSSGACWAFRRASSFPTLSGSMSGDASGGLGGRRGGRGGEGGEGGFPFFGGEEERAVR